MKAINQFLKSGAVMLALSLAFTSCGNIDNPLENLGTQENDFSVAFEDGAIVEFTYFYNGTQHTSSFKKVNGTYVLQSTPLDAGELKAIEELLALNDNELQFTVYFADPSGNENLADDSEFEIDDVSATRVAASGEIWKDHSPVGLRVNVNTATQELSSFANNEAFVSSDGHYGGNVVSVNKSGSGQNVKSQMKEEASIKVRVNYESSIYYIPHNSKDTWQDVIDRYEKYGLGDYLFEKDGKIIYVVKRGSGKKTKYHECWLKCRDLYASPLDLVSNASSYKLEKIRTKLTYINEDYTVEDGETLSGKLNKKYRLIIPDGYKVTLFGATIKYGNKEGGNPAIECMGDATIIIADGTENTVCTRVNNPVQTAITAPAGKTLTIKGQTNGTGKLKITGYAGVYAQSLSIEGGNTVISAIETGTIAPEGSDGGVDVSGGTLQIKTKEGTGVWGYLTVTGGEVGVETSRDDAVAINGACTISGGKITAKSNKDVAIVGTVNATAGTIIASAGHDKKAIADAITLGPGMKLYEGDSPNPTAEAENQAECTMRYAVIKPAP